MAIKIQSAVEVRPKIYAYNTPGIPAHDGWTKIGYTEKQTVEERINQQTQTADVEWTLAWADDACYRKEPHGFFTDKPFHDYLEFQQGVERKEGKEWFRIDGESSRRHFDDFAHHRVAGTNNEKTDYRLRDEQADAVARTAAAFAAGTREFLWNAKPRFGKTLSTYDLVMCAGFKKVLVVTNRPSVANSWAEDFDRFIGWRERYWFVSENDAIRRCRGVISRQQFVNSCCGGDTIPGMVAFESLQGLKGSVYFGGSHDKLKWISELEFDLLVVDESHEGVDTWRTERAFRNIKRKHTLYLSGTAFRAVKSGQFGEEQIFNWSYLDEQAAKAAWTGEEANPYEALPQMALFSYRMSDMALDKAKSGIELADSGETVDYAFDLNEFFAVKAGGEKFEHEAAVKRFLDALKTQEKYPFSTPELRDELTHTLWILNRVASVKALAKLLKEDEVFGAYEIVIAAGDGRSEADEELEDQRAFNRVRAAIKTGKKTITLSVGQLTVGVTVPEWSAVMMLCNLESAAAYIQAAFRVQNPWRFERDGKLCRKETAYIFDFDPVRTLVVYDEFARNQAARRGVDATREEMVGRLLNFFPVIGEDTDGKMVELDAQQVLVLPHKMKSEDVVKRGFMSNYLFKDIGLVFRATGAVKEILEKLKPAKDGKLKNNDSGLDQMDDVPVNDAGEVEIPEAIVIGQTEKVFGPKIRETITLGVETAFRGSGLGQMKPGEDCTAQTAAFEKSLVSVFTKQVVAPVAEADKLKASETEKLEKAVATQVKAVIKEATDDHRQAIAVAEAEYRVAQENAANDETAVKAAAAVFKERCEIAHDKLKEDLLDAAEEMAETLPREVIETVEVKKAETVKNEAEEDVRARLRGFARTIPSFVMAYGDDALTLANFDAYTPDDVFLDVAGITKDDFRFLRDGGDWTDPATGRVETFRGGIFDEVVFNDSIREFLAKKRALANWFDDTVKEDIFNYIPPQKTNQIFTPRWVVEKMVNEMEKENPGCFDDPEKTFADLYMKSGLFITEIAKRLYRSAEMKRKIPDDGKRIRHILEKQVYGVAPTAIIYRIAVNYILGFDEILRVASTNFIQADMDTAIKNGTTQELLKFNGREKSRENDD